MKRTGFTLIELLVVIAIIAILAAILFPLYLSAKEHGRMAKCIYNLKNLSIAFRTYADDNNGRLPAAFVAWVPAGVSDWCGDIATKATTVNLERGAIWRYTGRNRQVFLCPTDAGQAPRLMPTARDYPLSYSMNWALGANKAVAACQGYDRVAVDSIRYTSRMLLLIQEGRDHQDDGCFYWYSTSGNINLPGSVHYEGTTVVYLDGHAVWRSHLALEKESTQGWWDPLSSRQR